jgi:hypothetical protein
VEQKRRVPEAGVEELCPGLDAAMCLASSRLDLHEHIGQIKSLAVAKKSTYCTNVRTTLLQIVILTIWKRIKKNIF